MKFQNDPTRCAKTWNTPTPTPAVAKIRKAKWEKVLPKEFTIATACYVPYHKSTPSPSPSIQWRCRRHIVGSLHHHAYVPSASSANFHVIPGPPSSYQTRSRNKLFHGTSLLHLAPLSLCNHSHMFLDTAIYGVSTTQIFTSPHAHFHFTMCFLIFDILSTMCSLLSYKPLCFSPSYLNVEYFPVSSQFWIST